MNIELKALVPALLIGGTILGSFLGPAYFVRSNDPPPNGKFAEQSNVIKDTKVAAGAKLYSLHCARCHGAEGKGGVSNPNAKPAELVPGLIHVAQGYTNKELKDRILDGQPEIPVLDPQRPPPPLSMPGWRGVISDVGADDLVAYLVSLKPAGDESDF